MKQAALILLMLCLPLGTAPGELATGLALAAALLVGDRSERPLLFPLMAVAAAWLGSAAGHGQAAAVEALGRTWPLALVVAVPMLARHRSLDAAAIARIGRIGLAAAGVAVAWAAVQVVGHGEPPWSSQARGPFSHHLTLGYGLLPPLAWALATRQWWAAAGLGIGVGLAGSSGPLLALAVVAVAVFWRPLPALLGGAAAALGVIGLLRGDPELHQRVVLWATGASLAVSEPLGTGPTGFRTAAAVVQDRLQPGFHFPLHAHDSALQLAALAGWGAWIAWAWLLVVLWQQSGRAGRAALAGLAVGGLTQDTLGDLEVVRALCAWALLGNPAAAERVHSSEEDG